MATEERPGVALSLVGWDRPCPAALHRVSVVFSYFWKLDQANQESPG